LLQLQINKSSDQELFDLLVEENKYNNMIFVALDIILVAIKLIILGMLVSLHLD